jgi:SAM-dependent methyltransferase
MIGAPATDGDTRVSTLAATGPNAEQITFWNETAAPRWLNGQQALDTQLAPLGREALERARLVAGERVLDVGCGCGHTTLELAARVGPRGAVTGIDISAPLLARARARVQAAGLANVKLLNADAQVTPLGENAFDLVFSRFGVMFFADPKAAFANLRASLTPRGRVVFVCWQELARNPWMAVSLQAASKVVALPPPLPPGAPGPFAFADAARVRGILEGAGFADVEIEPREGKLVVGGEASDASAAADFLLEVGPLSAALREAGEVARPRVFAAVRDAIAPYTTPDGVALGYGTWVVHAAARR